MEKLQLKAIIEAILFMSTEPLSTVDIKKLLKTKGVVPEIQVEAEEEPEVIPIEAASRGEPQEPTEGLDAAEDVGSKDEGALAQLEKIKSQLEEEISVSEIKDILCTMMSETQNDESKGFELVQVAKGFQFRTKLAMAPYIKNLYRLPKPRLSSPSMETLAIVAYQQPVTRNKVEEVRGVDSGGVLKTLLDRDLVRIVGRSEEAGRPILYGTTKSFLETFGLNSLSDLPTLKDLESLEESSLTSGEEQSESEAEPINYEEEVQAMDEESSQLVDELENSMRNLKDLEKKIFTKPEEEITDEFTEKPIEEFSQSEAPQVEEQE